MARAPVSKTGGWGFESLHSCQPEKNAPSTLRGRRNGVDRHLGHARLIDGAGVALDLPQAPMSCALLSKPIPEARSREWLAVFRDEERQMIGRGASMISARAGRRGIANVAPGLL
jgi:hypothetical protein